MTGFFLLLKMEESIKIELNSKASSVIKTGLTVRALFILLPVIGSITMGINFLKESITASFILIVIGLVLFRVFFKMLDSVFFKEYIILTKQQISIVHKTVSSLKKYDFNLNDIIYLGFAEQHYTKNQMDNPVVDFTGLGVGERELQYVIDEGNIKLETATKAIKFGKNMPSWDVEEVIGQIESFIGSRFNAPNNDVEEEADA